ncbi:MAG: SPW repeat protein [Hyphomicrobiales bacterium]|nr:SPW repeat protein [Hyphomicrobiales bacterium]
MSIEYRGSSRVKDWINLILAVLLFISPWVLGYAGEAVPAWNAWILAVVIAILALAAISAFAVWEEWITGLLGIWLIIAPWVLSFAANPHALWAHVVLGVITAIVSFWSVWDYRHTPHAA